MGLATAQCFPSHLPMAETPAEPESELLQGLNPPTHFTDKETEAERGGARHQHSQHPDLQSLSHHLGAPPSYRTGVQPFSLVTSVDLGWQLENWVGEQSPLKLPQNTLLAGYRYTQAGREPRDIMAAVNMEFWHCANLNSHFNSPSLGSRIPIL